MTTKSIAYALGIAGLLALGACNKGATSEGPTATSDNTTTQAAQATSDNAGGGAGPNMAKAKDMFNTRCATCHGPEGKGNGPGAVALNPKPRNYHDKEWQAKVTDEDIKKTITYGGAAVGKSPIMPASPDLDAKPEVVEGLVKIIRDFGKQ
jgi:cytochrome c553